MISVIIIVRHTAVIEALPTVSERIILIHKTFPSSSGITEIQNVYSFHRKYGRQLTVEVRNPLQVGKPGKQRQLHFQEDRVARPSLGKNRGNDVVLFWPSASF